MTGISTVPDLVYRRAFDWLAEQPRGAMPMQLIARVRLETWRWQHGGENCPAGFTNQKSPNVITSFENRGFLLSEDAEGRLYAWGD